MNEYSEYDDRTLFMLLKADDQAAFSELYARFSSVLLHFALKTMKHEEEAADIVHDVFVVLWEHRHSLEIHTSVSAFLYRSVLHAALNRVKRVQFFERYVNYMYQMRLDMYAPSELKGVYRLAKEN